MSKLPVPKSRIAATKLLERYADLASRVELIEADRKDRIAAANGWADTAAGPMLDELANLATVLEDWWKAAGAGIAQGDQKSVQLGGCMIGTRLARATVGHSFDDDKAATAALVASRYAKYTTKVSFSLDRTALLKLLDVGGKTAANLGELGFRIVPGSDQFFIKRVEQTGSITA